MENAKTKFKWFHQADNKDIRIYSNSAAVQNLTFMPQGWIKLFPEFAAAINGYLKIGKNSHDDACFVAGTKVATICGLKNIENVRIGEYVITPFGYRKVIDSGCTGMKQVITNIGLTGTENHKVFYKNRFDCLAGIDEKFVSLLSFKNLLIWEYKKLLCSMELSTNLWGRENIILANQKEIMAGNMQKDFMLQFGNFIINKKFRKAFVFTTKMAILLITTFAIWNVYQSGNTLANMRKRICKTLNMLQKTDKILTRQGLKLMNGTEAKRGSDGIENIRETNCELKRNLFVRIVAMALNLLCPIRCFVAKSAENNIDENMQESHIPQNVSIAEKNLRQLKLNQANPKRDFVQGLAQIGIVQRVYNITVEKDGCYYANGILVSNCDALTGTVEKRKKRAKQDVAGLFGF